MAEASLSGIRIEVEHSTPRHEVTDKLESFAEDLARNRFPHWDCRIDRQDDGNLHLVGGRDGTHFKAVVATEETRVVLDVDGRVSIGRVKLTLAGGAEGLRRRVRDEIERALRSHLT